MYTYHSLWYPDPVNLHIENLLGQCQYLLLKIGIIAIVIVSQYMYTYRSLWYPDPVNLHHENLSGTVSVSPIKNRYNSYSYHQSIHVHIPFTLVSRPCEPPPLRTLLGQCQYLLLKIGIIAIAIVSQYMYTYRSL